MAAVWGAYDHAAVLAAGAAVARYTVVLKVYPEPYAAQHSAYPGLVGHTLVWVLLGGTSKNTPLAVFAARPRVFYRIPVVV